MSLFAELKKDATGAAILKDWLGGGGQTVSQVEAEARAAICLHCPEHKGGNWWSTHFRSPIAKAITRQLEIKHKAGLRLSCEWHLFMCARCGCCLRLKAWVPIEHIAAHTDPEQLKLYPEFCWIRNSIERLPHG